VTAERPRLGLSLLTHGVTPDGFRTLCDKEAARLRWTRNAAGVNCPGCLMAMKDGKGG
jgi:hypothetical protein